jgi:hypothetical protein
MTTNHVLALRTVLPNGELIWTGNGSVDTVGYDLAGVMTGSEGMFGIVTEAWVRMTRLPESLPGHAKRSPISRLPRKRCRPSSPVACSPPPSK